jgi:hypothetical protein
LKILFDFFFQGKILIFWCLVVAVKMFSAVWFALKLFSGKHFSLAAVALTRVGANMRGAGVCQEGGSSQFYNWE